MKPATLDGVIENRWRHYCRSNGIRLNSQFAEETKPVYAMGYRIGVSDSGQTLAGMVTAAQAVVDNWEFPGDLAGAVRELSTQLERLK